METECALSLRECEPVALRQSPKRVKARKNSHFGLKQNRRHEIEFHSFASRQLSRGGQNDGRMPTKRPQERGLPAFTTNLKSSPSSLAFAISTVHPTWIAGESVEGTLELSVLKDNVWLGEIALEFTAFEGQSRVAFCTHFLHSSTSCPLASLR